MARESATYWVDYPSTASLITATALNNIESALDSQTGTLRTYPVTAKYKLTADQTLTTATNTQVTGWTSVSDKDAIFASNAWTVPLAGRSWHVQTVGRYGGSTGGGYRYMYLIINSTSVTTATILAQGGGIVAAVLAAPGDYCTAVYDGPLNSGDVIRVFTAQSSGGNLVLSAATQSANYGDTWFSIADAGPA